MTKTKYVSYIRASTKKQGESGLGLDAQKRIIDYFTKDGEIVGEYREIYSGKDLTKCVFLREAVNKAKELGAKLILAKSDRFRDLSEALNIMKELGEGNLICCDIPNADEFTYVLFFAIAERERKIISLRTSQSLESVNKNIEANGSHISKAGNEITRLGRPSGSKESPEAKQRREEAKIFKSRPIPTEREAEILRHINFGKSKGLSYQDTADHLNILFSDKDREEYFKDMNDKREAQGREKSILFTKSILSNLWIKYEGI